MNNSETGVLICRLMFRLQQLSMVQFRNYEGRSFGFSERIVGICGPNGTGKTNLLDAIYYLSFSKSYFNRTDSQSVHHGSMGMRLNGLYQMNNAEKTVTLIVRETGKKELQLDAEPYKKFSDHIGSFPIVMIAPDDVELISGPGEERRKFLDTVLSQINPQYLQQLIDYNKILQQRNSLLKQSAESGMHDETLFAILNEQLCKTGTILFHTRQQFLQTFLPLAFSIYERIARSNDGIYLSYHSPLLKTDFPALLQQNRSKDFALQRTSSGIHRDDIVLQMGEQLFKNEASQGQRKSLLFALKLAEWQILKEQKGFTPILLLDDVFEKLDDSRMNQLLHWVCAESDGQVFITDTHPERLQQQLESIGTGFQMIEL
ncbi:DNA replication/repair protein RecF [Sediminibacterium goheungense]